MKLCYGEKRTRLGWGVECRVWGAMSFSVRGAEGQWGKCREKGSVDT